MRSVSGGLAAPNGALVSDQANTASSASFTFQPLAYSKLAYALTYGTGGTVSSLTLAGMTAGTYHDLLTYALVTGALNGARSDSLNQWLNGGLSAGRGTVAGEIWLPPAPEWKSHHSVCTDATATRRFSGGATGNVDPAGIVFTFSASIAFRLKVWGWP